MSQNVTGPAFIESPCIYRSSRSFKGRNSFNQALFGQIQNTKSKHSTYKEPWPFKMTNSTGSVTSVYAPDIGAKLSKLLSLSKNIVTISRNIRNMPYQCNFDPKQITRICTSLGLRMKFKTLFMSDHDLLLFFNMSNQFLILAPGGLNAECVKVSEHARPALALKKH